MLLFVVLLSSSCATVISGGQESISIDSFPRGAKIYDEDELLGVTPLKITIEKQTFDQHELTLKKEHYETGKIRLEKKFNSLALLNAIVLPFWGIDAITGAIIEYSPSAYFLNLKPSSEEIKRRRALKFATLYFEKLKRELAAGNGIHLQQYAHYAGLKIDSLLSSRQSLLSTAGPLQFHLQAQNLL